MFFSLSSGAFVSFIIQAGLIGWDLVFRPNRRRWKVLAWLSAAAYITVDAIRTDFHSISLRIILSALGQPTIGS